MDTSGEQPITYDPGSPATKPAPVWRATWVTGPDAGCTTWLGAGRWLVGRAPQAHVRCDDPVMAPFHLELTLWPHGEVQVVQLAGRTPVQRSGGVLRLGTSGLTIEPHAVGEQAGPGCDRPVQRVVRRRPRVVPLFEPVPVARPIDPDDRPSPLGGGALGSSVIALAGALVVAVVVGHSLMVVFAAVGAMGSLVTWIVSRLATRRRTRRSRAGHEADVARFVDQLRDQRTAALAHHRVCVATLERALAVLAADAPELWERRSSHADAFEVSTGTGPVPFVPVLTDEPWPSGRRTLPLVPLLPADPADPAAFVESMFPEVAVPLALGPRARVFVDGPYASALVRSLVLQLAVQTGPADWQLVVVSDDPARWASLYALPHLRDRNGVARVVDERELLALVRDPDSLDDRHLVVVCDRPDLLAVRTSAVRRLIAGRESIALLALDAHQGAGSRTAAASTPSMCITVVTTTTDGGARQVADVSAATAPVVVRMAGAGVASTDRWCRRFLGLHDPEDLASIDAGLPGVVPLATLLAERRIDVGDPASIAAAWDACAPDAAPVTPIGVARDGVVDVDLVRDGPHGLMAGTTGSGKSELLRSLVLGLCCTVPPDQLTFVLVDYKGGAAFDALVRLPHVVGVVTDLDPALAERMLRSLRAELAAREQLLRAHAAPDLTSLRARLGCAVVPRLVVVVDEFAALATEQADVLHALVDIAQRGRSLGVHLLLATQRPSGVISDDIRANTNLRLALRLHDHADAVDVVGDAAPASFHRATPGRCALRLGPDELVTFQSARAIDAEKTVDAIVMAASRGDHRLFGQPRRPWCDPLPARLDRDSLPPACIGLVDDPDTQSQRPLHVPADGHLLVVGAVGMGVTSTLTAAARAVVDGPNGASTTLVVIDGGDDDRWLSMATHERCAGVVRPDEPERLLRALRRALAGAPAQQNDTQQNDAQQNDAQQNDAQLIVVIDGIGAVRRALEPIARSAELDLLDLLVAAAPADVQLMVGADAPASVSPSMLGRFAHRWVLHLRDRHDAAHFGVSPSSAVADIPGRLAIAGAHLHAQICAGPPPAGARRHAIVERIRTLPIDVHASALRADALTADGRGPDGRGPDGRGPDGRGPDDWRPIIGIAFDTLVEHCLDVADGEHVLVAGPARSGRSTTLVRLADAWLDAVPNGALFAVAPRRSPLSQFADARPIDSVLDDVVGLVSVGRPVLLLVDDAEMVADPGGRLAAMVTARTSCLVLVAAGRPEALRQSYGHWTVAVRRSGLGLLMSGCDDFAGDLLGVTLPRWMPLAPRPGLAHAVTGGTATLVQVAHSDPSVLLARMASPSALVAVQGAACSIVTTR